MSGFDEKAVKLWIKGKKPVTILEEKKFYFFSPL